MTSADLSRDEILMFLNTPEPGGHLSAMLDECTEALCKAAQPRTIYRVLPVGHTENGVTLGGLPLQGADIALHLTGCNEAVLLAATLFIVSDDIIKICLIWAVWSIIREGREIAESAHHIREKRPGLINLIESIVIIVL